MQDAPNGFDIPMLGLPKDEWLTKLEEVVDEHGYFQPLGDRHFATFVEDKPTLLVTFETLQGIQSRGDTGQPMGFELVRELGWSHLCLMSDGDTWFRDDAVYRYIDRLVDDGFFEDFQKVIFYGSGACGYAAAAFSVAAPGATVITVQPQATLDPRIAGWDHRFPHTRKMSFTDRYGYAPDMIDAADHAFVLFDPNQTEDAMHAALFARENVTLLRMPNMGSKLEPNLLNMQILYRILAQAGGGKLSSASFNDLYRARRNHKPYLLGLLHKLKGQKRPYLEALLCANVTQRMKAPRFANHLNALEQSASEEKRAG